MSLKTTQSVYDSVLQGLVSLIQNEPKPHEVTKEKLFSYARVMSRNGYRFSELSLEALELYLKGYGLYLHGSVGTGKTFFFDCLSKTLTKPIQKFSMYDLFGKGESAIRDFIEDRVEYEMLIDDIGAEPVFNNYGVKYDALAYILEMRLKSKFRTHFTTNLETHDVAKRYGVRVIDRITQMCKSTKLIGQSNRSPKIYAS